MVLAVGSADTSGVLKKMEVERRAPEAHDVDIEIHYCGICHSDLHQICAEWPGPAIFPMVPGHEVVGVVRSVGSAVTKWKVGDNVGVGCFVDSCRSCGNCKLGDEQYCAGGMVGTYNGTYKWATPKTKHTTPEGKEMTFGGYSQSMTVDENYVLRIPDGMDMAKAAPLLCAGITTYSPLAFWGALKKGKDCAVGVAGFGGLGHMAVKIAIAAGCPVTVFSHSANKKEAVDKLGAKFVLTTDAAQMTAAAGTIDLLLNTISANHDMASLLGPLKAGPGACLVMLGVPPDNLSMHAFGVIGGRKQVAGSLIGGIKETQEMLDFCGKHNILPDIHLIHPKESNHAMAALHTGKMPSTAESRFVIDIKGGLVEGDWEVEDDEVWCKADKACKVHAYSTVIPATARHDQPSTN